MFALREKGENMKTYRVTQVFNGSRDFQHIQAESREDAIEQARIMLDYEEQVNESFADDWFAEVEEDEE